MSLFGFKNKPSVPVECVGMEVRVQSSICTGEKTIGFYDRQKKQLVYTELVRSQKDIDAFYEKYGLKKSRNGSYRKEDIYGKKY